MTRTLCIGVAGGTGSGKTTVSEAIVNRVGSDRIAVINQDRYYHDLSHVDESQWLHHNFDHPSAVEEQLFVSHVRMLKDGLPAPMPMYDFTRHVRLAEVEQVEPRPVILIEGILILAIAQLRDLMDIKIFVDTDPDIRLIRRLQRDMEQRGRTLEGVVTQYLATVRPMHLEFVEPSKRWADVIIPEGGFNTVALELVISRIEAMLTAAE
jgi:uridine kinase